MTRDEAIAKVGGNAVRAREIVHALGALGLAQFDAPKPITHLDALCEDLGMDKYSADAFKEMLQARGLRVVRA